MFEELFTLPRALEKHRTAPKLSQILANDCSSFSASFSRSPSTRLVTPLYGVFFVKRFQSGDLS